MRFSMLNQCVIEESETTFTDEELRRTVRAMLPPDAFRRSPWRLGYVALLIGILVAASYGAMVTPWYFAIPLSLLAGHCFAGLMFFGHEVAHGAVTGSRALQDLMLYTCCFIYCLPPSLWRLWHNGIHHAHANVDIRDPDHFGMIPKYEQSGFFRRLVVHCAPGSGNPLSVLYPFLFFTGQSMSVLWHESAVIEDFRALNRTRAKIECILMALFWVGLCIATGWKGTLYLVAIPMLVANFTVMIYIFTNHVLRPLKGKASALDGTMSVTTIPLLDRLHFHFSHHIEHHLFPSLSSRHYPLVRKALQEIAGDRYLAPSHWWAVMVLYKTPKVYATPETFVEPRSGRRVSVASVEELLSLH